MERDPKIIAALDEAIGRDRMQGDPIPEPEMLIDGLARQGYVIVPTGAADVQWGVRTTCTDGSQGVDWTNEDDAVSFLHYYAEHDVRPEMRVRVRELVRRPVAAGDLEVVASQYDERRANAEQRRAEQLDNRP
jgi:hypothetical protein